MRKWLKETFKGNEKIISASVSIPIIAAGAMSGACAAGCPYGLVNDPYPGQCPRYIDVTGDGICDLSQGAAASTTTPDTTQADTTNTTATVNDHSASTGVSPDIGTLNQNDSVNASAVDSGSGLYSFGDGGGYHILPVSILLLSGYFLTHFLFNKGILSRKKHKRLWNLLLTAGYAGTGITGILLVLLVNLGIRTALNPSITFWHAELSILMVIGTLIHLHIYRKPIKKMSNLLFGFNSNTNKKSLSNTKSSK